MTTTTTTPSSTPALFYPFRALGYITENVPFATQRRGTETFVTVSAGRAWQIYNCDKLRLALVGPQFDGEIVALAVRNDLTFAAVGRDIHVCRRAHKVVTLRAHAAQITSLFVFASLLISVCADGRVMSWDCSREAIDHLDGKISNASRRAREKRERASMAKHEDPEGGGKGGGGSDSDGDGDGDGSDAAALKLRKDATDLPKTDEDGVPRPREFRHGARDRDRDRSSFTIHPRPHDTPHQLITDQSRPSTSTRVTASPTDSSPPRCATRART
tara:strand:+ start:168 stop:986 length:819 start_codon:yes stop_codon:yes gene_type:complete